LAREKAGEMRVDFKPACSRDLPDRHIGFCEEARDVVHPATMNFIHRCTAQALFESVLQCASGKAGDRREVRDLEIPMVVLADETQGPDEGGVFDGQDVGRLPGDGVSGVDRNHPGAGMPSGH